MTIPIEMILALLTFNGAFISLMCHMLVKIMGTQSTMAATMQTRFAVIDYKLGISPKPEGS